jgi:hypothetical protein
MQYDLTNLTPILSLHFPNNLNVGIGQNNTPSHQKCAFLIVNSKLFHHSPLSLVVQITIASGYNSTNSSI